MKVGLVLECGLNGPDDQVCRLLIGRLRAGVDIEVAGMSGKHKLISDCGQATANLLHAGCDRVVIAWDLRPAWQGTKVQPCRRRDREQIQKSLAAARVNPAKVFLVCIEAMLEAWLLADERALEAVLNRSAHPVRVKPVRYPEREPKPKAVLRELFKQNGWPPYNDVIDAIRIARAIPDWTRLRRCSTFVRFAKKAVDVDV